MSDSAAAAHEEQRTSVPGDPSMQLPPRLSEVARGVANGRSDKEIAASMHISEEGVGHHVKKLFSLLDVRNRTQAAIKLITAGVKCA